MAVGMIAGATTLIAAPTASAAGPGLSITAVTTTPSTVSVGDQLETDIDFTVADGTPAGDTTELTLPSALVSLPTGFDVRTSDGILVATAAISSGSPAVITFTTTDYAQTHLDVHGSAFVKDNFDAAVAPPGQTTPLKYVSGSTTFTSELTVLPGSSIDRTGAFKFGQFVRPDQGRDEADGAIYWFIESPVAPNGGWTSVEFKDLIPAGEAMECSTVKVTIGDGGGPGGGFENGTGFGDYQFAQPCSPTSLDLLTGPVGKGKIVRVQFTTDLASPTGSTQTTFVNRATVITTSVYGGAMTHPAGGSLVQSSAGGSAVGSNPPPPSTTSSTTSTTSSTEPTTSTSTTSSTEPTTSTSTTSSTEPTTSTSTTSSTEPTTSTSTTSSTQPTTSTSTTSSTVSTVTTRSTTPIPVSPSPTSPISTTSNGTTIQVLPTTESLTPTTSTTSSDSGTTTEPLTTSVLPTTTTTSVLASTGSPVRSAAVVGGLLLLLGAGLLLLTTRRRSEHR